MGRWHILTPELPPDCGGVGDYTFQVGGALAAAGDEVTIYCPPRSGQSHVPAGVAAVTLEDRFGPRSLRELSARLDADPASTLLVEYVPAVFGQGGANLRFCRWIRSRTRANGDVRVMFHEPYLYFRWRPDHVVAAVAQRAMARILLEAGPLVYLSTDTWRRYLSPYGAAAVAASRTLPIPSAIPRVNLPDAVSQIRSALLGRATQLVGHFGSYGSHVAPLIRHALRELLSSDRTLAAVCLGAGSDTFVHAMLSREPALKDRLIASGRLDARDVSLRIQACDVLLQPFPDGVTTRRTSVMAALANGRAVVTSEGPLTERVWRETESVALASSRDAFVSAARMLLSNPAARDLLAQRGATTYESRFDLPHTVAALRQPVHAHA